MNNNTTSIINVTVNGMSANDCIKSVKARLESVEKSAFNIALLCAYTLGDTIPAYTDNKGNAHGEATCDKPIKKQADLLKLIGRSKATLSRWIKAIRLIIEKGYFTDFSNGTLPFSYDKIILILENEANFEGYVLTDLLSMTVDSLEAMVDSKKDTEEAEAEATTEAEATNDTQEAEDEAEVEVTEDEATFVYNDTQYIVNKALFEKWLSENAKIA